MDHAAPPGVDGQDLLAMANTEWGLDADGIEYLPKGAGSYHWAVASGAATSYFATVDDLDTKPWIAAGRDDTFAGLQTAYDAAWALQHGAGLGFVVGPLRTLDGSVVERLSSRYSVAMFPFVAGTPGTWGRSLSRDARNRLLEQLARLHRATGGIETTIARRPLDVAERPQLLAAIDALDTPWDAGPYSEPARRALSRHGAAVSERLVDLDALARRLDGTSHDVVITHGEPHPGNLIRTEKGFRLVDWDTVALALPERDLWMLDDGSPQAFVPYERAVEHNVDAVALHFFRLAWSLSDIASFAHLFRMPHEQNAWAEQKWKAFEHLLEGGSSTPYGPVPGGTR
jgi:spectinomycin phosphotransferase